MRVESQQLKSFLLDSELISETDLEKAEEVSVEEEKPLKENGRRSNVLGVELVRPAVMAHGVGGLV